MYYRNSSAGIYQNVPLGEGDDRVLRSYDGQFPPMHRMNLDFYDTTRKGVTTPEERQPTFSAENVVANEKTEKKNNMSEILHAKYLGHFTYTGLVLLLTAAYAASCDHDLFGWKKTRLKDFALYNTTSFRDFSIVTSVYSEGLCNAQPSGCNFKCYFLGNSPENPCIQGINTHTFGANVTAVVANINQFKQYIDSLTGCSLADSAGQTNSPGCTCLSNLLVEMQKSSVSLIHMSPLAQTLPVEVIPFNTAEKRATIARMCLEENRMPLISSYTTNFDMNSYLIFAAGCYFVFAFRKIVFPFSHDEDNFSIIFAGLSYVFLFLAVGLLFFHYIDNTAPFIVWAVLFFLCAYLVFCVVEGMSYVHRSPDIDIYLTSIVFLPILAVLLGLKDEVQIVSFFWMGFAWIVSMGMAVNVVKYHSDIAEDYFFLVVVLSLLSLYLFWGLFFTEWDVSDDFDPGKMHYAAFFVIFVILLCHVVPMVMFAAYPENDITKRWATYICMFLQTGLFVYIFF